VSNLVKLLIWAAVVGGLFGVLWWQGYLVQIRDYVQQTREELRKCTWPTWDELKGSTVVVTVSILLLGGFIMLSDFIFVHVMVWISKV
jgi:preprotein translocase subunit SecE